jgi:hypothetical protein
MTTRIEHALPGDIALPADPRPGREPGLLAPQRPA